MGEGVRVGIGEGVATVLMLHAGSKANVAMRSVSIAPRVRKPALMCFLPFLVRRTEKRMCCEVSDETGESHRCKTQQDFCTNRLM